MSNVTEVFFVWALFFLICDLDIACVVWWWHDVPLVPTSYVHRRAPHRGQDCRLLLRQASSRQRCARGARLDPEAPGMGRRVRDVKNGCCEPSYSAMWDMLKQLYVAGFDARGCIVVEENIPS